MGTTPGRYSRFEDGKVLTQLTICQLEMLLMLMHFLAYCSD